MMIGYYFVLGLRHLRRNPILTVLMVVTLACGIAASMSTLTVLRAMSSDPLPHKSDRVITPLLDVRPNDGRDPDPDPPEQLSYRDAIALHAAHKGVRQTLMYQIGPVIESPQPNVAPVSSRAMAVHADFFAIIDAPFVKGGAWSAEDDARGGNVAVVRQAIADKMFGATDPIGKTVRIATKDFVVVGVLPDDWEPTPHFYRAFGGPGSFAESLDLLVPFTTAIALEWDQAGSVNCHEQDPLATTFKGLMQTNCVWIAAWFELASASEIGAFRDFLAAYQAEQRKLGRFPRPDNHRVHDVNGWLAEMRVVSRDAKTQTYLAFGFLLVCLVNVIGLLLAKFTARAGEIGVRRALGARRTSVFAQYLIEAAVVGFVGGLVGLALTFGSLWLLGRQSDTLARLAHMDWVMLATTLGLAVAASLLAGLLPTWRAMQIQPALQLKSQ